MVSKSLLLLLADDDKDDCLLFKEALEELPVSVKLTCVHEGDQLMQFLIQNTMNERFDVLFLDLNMPRKNGFSCLEEIKAHKKLKQLPVIIFSTSFDQNIADMLYAKGAHLCLCKPSDYSQLKRLIHRALQIVKQWPIIQPPKKIFLLSDLKPEML